MPSFLDSSLLLSYAVLLPLFPQRRFRCSRFRQLSLKRERKRGGKRESEKEGERPSGSRFDNDADESAINARGARVRLTSVVQRLTLRCSAANLLSSMSLLLGLRGALAGAAGAVVVVVVGAAAAVEPIDDGKADDTDELWVAVALVKPLLEPKNAVSVAVCGTVGAAAAPDC